jgi:hypothetical protein
VPAPATPERSEPARADFPARNVPTHPVPTCHAMPSPPRPCRPAYPGLPKPRRADYPSRPKTAPPCPVPTCPANPSQPSPADCPPRNESSPEMPACLSCGGPIAPKNKYGYCARTPECRARYQKASQTAHRRARGAAFNDLMQEVRDREHTVRQAAEDAETARQAVIREIERAGYYPTPGPPDRWFTT